ncbi:MAG: hypothetical protein ACOCU0_03875 [Bacillota bacterium]
MVEPFEYTDFHGNYVRAEIIAGEGTFSESPHGSNRSDAFRTLTAKKSIQKALI